MSSRSITNSYHFQESLPIIWNCITVNEYLTQWMVDTITGRPREGEAFSWSWKFGEEGDFITNGIYKKIVYQKELVMQWTDHPAGDIELRLVFAESPHGGTILTLINSGYPSSKAFDSWVENADESWDETVERLREFLKKNPNPQPISKS